MARIRIEGVKPYDGEYELDPERAFNAREWRWVKKISGYLPLTIEDGFAGRDPDLFVALAVIALCREGKINRDAGLRVADELAEVPFDGVAITLVGDEADEEDDAVPPDLTSEPDGSSPNDSLEKTNTSGESSRNDSARSDETPSVTTLLRSGTSSESSLTELAS